MGTCSICGRPGADIHTGLCGPCHVELPAYFRRQAEQRAIQAALVHQALVGGQMGGIRWNEKQYQDFLRKQQEPAPREERKAKAGGSPPKRDKRTLVFELELTPMRNALDRMHYRTKRRLHDRLAAAFRAQLPNASGTPFGSAKVEIIRYSSKQPDRDGLYGSAKPILDAMQVASKRHPYGAYVIENDDPDTIDLDVRWEKCSPRAGKVIVLVTPKP